MELRSFLAYLLGRFPELDNVFDRRHSRRLGRLVHCHPTSPQFLQQIHIVNREHQKRIVVNLPAHHIDNRRQMLARHRPVRAAALHLEVSPFFRKYLEPTLRSDVHNRRIQLMLKQFRDDVRPLHNPLDKPLDILREERRDNNGH